MRHFEETLQSDEIFSGRILRLTVDRVRLENGRESSREVVHHHGGVAVLAHDGQENLLFVRQFRYPYRQELWELPAGKLEKGEDPLACGIRELEEETGYRAGHWESLGIAYPSPGYTDEVLYLYSAGDLTETAPHPDENEFLSVERLPLAQAVAKVLRGEIPDAKTQIAVLKYWAMKTQT